MPLPAIHIYFTPCPHFFSTLLCMKWYTTALSINPHAQRAVGATEAQSCLKIPPS